MRENLVSVIKQYLQIETNYAVIINGNYGIGKTHFYKNSLSPEIIKLPTPKNEQKKYIPIHISLFGITTLEEIQTQIFCSIYPILKKKGLKLAAGLGKSIIRGIVTISNLGDLDKYIADIDLTSKDWINYDEIVICFDDIDRKSDSLSIKDLLGFINTLVENHGAKIILIANEDTLQKDENYIKLKEKIIGISIEFAADIDEAFESIINERYLENWKVYHKFLNSNRELIISTTTKNLCNLRNLIFFLEHFSIIYYPLKDLFETNKDFSKNEEEKLRIVLEFSIAIAFEFKIGKLNSINYQEFLNNTLLLPNLEAFYRDNLPDKKIEIKKTYIEEFKEKYFDKRNYYFFDAIFNYLIGHEPFSIIKLKAELDSIYNKDGDVSEELKVFNQLNYFNCLEFTTKAYRKLTQKMLEYVDSGSYNLAQYPTIFHFTTRFDNVLRFNIQNLKSRFKKGILKGINHYTLDNYLHFQLAVDENAEFKEDILEIMKYCLEINDRIKKEKHLKDLNDLLKLLEKDIKGFISVVQDQNSQFRFSPFFLDVSPDRMYTIINRLNNNDIIEFGFYLQYRYRPIIFDKLHPEKGFLINLKDKINLPKKRKIKNLRNAALDFLVKHIDESISNFDK